MGDFFAIVLVLVALATAGNFAGAGPAVSGNCKGNFVQICW